MTSRRFLLFVALVATVILMGSRLPADTIAAADLPPAVTKALASKYPGAQITSITRDERNDFVYYTIKLRDGDADRQVTLTDLGQFREK